MKLLLKEITPESGSIRQGTNLKVAYFDQSRDTLKESHSVADNVAEGREFIDINGKSKHVMGYLNDFYLHQRARTPVSALSGEKRIGCCWQSFLASPPISLFWMNRPTIWMLKPWSF